MKTLRLAINSISHLVVDAACFFVLYSCVKNITPFGGMEQSVLVWGLFLIYNFIAFGLQFVFGYIYDLFPKIKMAVIGVTFVAVGVLLDFSPVLSMIFVALGNALFHVGGGADTLNESNGMKESGVFVSFGAIGVYLGTRIGTIGANKFIVFAVLLVFCAAEYIVSRIKIEKKEAKPCLNEKLNFSLSFAILFVAIVIRAFSGGALPKPIDNQSFTLISVMCVFVGKLIGGFIADYVSPKKAIFVALILSAFISLFENAYTYCIAILLFNVAMPITLYGLYLEMPNNAGLAFGLSTLALLLGTIPLFFMSFQSAGRIVFVISTALVAIALPIVFRGEKKDATIS